MVPMRTDTMSNLPQAITTSWSDSTYRSAMNARDASGYVKGNSKDAMKAILKQILTEEIPESYSTPFPLEFIKRGSVQLSFSSITEMADTFCGSRNLVGLVDRMYTLPGFQCMVTSELGVHSIGGTYYRAVELARRSEAETFMNPIALILIKAKYAPIITACLYLSKPLPAIPIGDMKIVRRQTIDEIATRVLKHSMTISGFENRVAAGEISSTFVDYEEMMGYLAGTTIKSDPADYIDRALRVTLSGVDISLKTPQVI
jgi:hypothetical protein